jgi:signal transduction histidine kinase/ligand-binding sensor domain-containing protein/DNA-binding response OmpR family regulator
MISRTNKNFVLSLFTLILFTHVLSAQHIAIEQLSTLNGLSQNTVRCILQDKTGFIWFGTINGLNRYDGYKFMTFKPETDKSNLLTDSRIRDLHEDSHGYIWIRTYNNTFHCLDPQYNSFKEFYPKNIQSDYSYDAFYETKSGNIWFYSARFGCLFLQFKDNGWIPYIVNNDKNNPKTICDNSISFVFEDSKENIWIGTATGLSCIKKSSIDNLSLDATNYCNLGSYSFIMAAEAGGLLHFFTRGGLLQYDPVKQSFQYIPPPLKTNVLFALKFNKEEFLIGTTNQGVLVYNLKTKLIYKPENFDKSLPRVVYQILHDNAGAYWVSNNSGNIWRLDSVSHTVTLFNLIPEKKIGLIDNERFNVTRGPGNCIWISTYGNGLFCYRPSAGNIEHYKYTPSNANGLSSDYILSMRCDRTGTLWLGTENTGINKISGVKHQFSSYFPNRDITDPNSNLVRSVFQDTSGIIWISTKDGELHCYDPNMQKSSKYDAIIKKLNIRSNVYCFFQDHTGKIWLGTKGEGIFAFHPTDKKQNFEHYIRIPNNSTSLTNNQIYGFTQDDKNRLWIATFGGGVNLLVEEADGSKSFRSYFGNMDNVRQVRCISNDNKGNIWIGTSNGLIVFNPDTIISKPTKYEHYTYSPDKRNSLSSNEIKAIIRDRSGNVWIGTSNGLNKIVLKNNGKLEFEKYFKQQGLPNDNVQAILEDASGNLWIGTENGLTRFNTLYQTFENIRLSNNILGNLISEQAGIKTKSGEMLWGSADGFYVINPKIFVGDTASYPVVLTNFLISGIPVEIGDKDSPFNESIYKTKSIKLKSFQNSISIEFSTLIFNNKANNQFSYILENYDKEWNQSLNSNIATYKNLPQGTYLFKVKYKSHGAAASSNITTLKIRVLPPLWKSKAAILFYILVVFALLLISRRIVIRIHKLEHNIEIEKQLTEYKIKFFTNVSHEFRTPLSLILGSMERITETIKLTPVLQKHFQIMQRNTNRLLLLMDQLLDFAKVQNKSMKLSLRETEIIGFLKTIYTNFSDLAEKKQIHYSFSANIEKSLLFVDQNIIDKIGYNLLSNAFKFTPDSGEISFTAFVNSETKELSITVKDNGSGIPEDKQHLIFKRFAQIQTSTTGVGLSLTRELTELHKGRIEFDSNPGKGTTFTVTLNTNPALFDETDFSKDTQPTQTEANYVSQIIDADEEAMPVTQEIESLNNNKILVIEDNIEIRSYLVDYLGKYFKVDEAENGKIGLSKAAEIEPDLIVCDILMPEMDGIELTKRLKADFQTSHIPVLLLTAITSEESKLEGTEAGADEYITKPFSIKYLLTKIFKLIEQREALRKKFSSDAAPLNYTICRTDRDKQFLEKSNKIMEQQMTNPDFSVDEFAKIAGYGRTVFYKKIKGITGYTPNEFIRIMRMKKAMELLVSGNYTVSEVAHKVGMNDPFYFSRCFKAQFGQSPSVYLRGK